MGGALLLGPGPGDTVVTGDLRGRPRGRLAEALAFAGDKPMGRLRASSLVERCVTVAVGAWGHLRPVGGTWRDPHGRNK